MNRRTRLFPGALAVFCAVGAGPLFAPPAVTAQTPATAPAVDPEFARWFQHQDWQRDSDQPALALGEKGRFDDTHIFAPHVIYENGEYSMYYCGSQWAVENGTYKGVVKNRPRPEGRLYKVGLARSKDGIHFTRVSPDPILSFGDDIHSIVTPVILKNPDGTVHREDGKLRMYFTAIDFPNTYAHDLYDTTSEDGVHWSKPQPVMKAVYAPCVIKEGDRYRLWYTWHGKHPWCTKYAESTDGRNFTLRQKPCIVLDQDWEFMDQVYPMVIKVDGLYLMMYGAYWKDQWHTGIGFAVSKDGLTWTKHPRNPVFGPEPKNKWESNFTTSQTLMRLPDGTFRLWYAARTAPEMENGRPTWTHLYYAIGTAHWSGPGKKE